MKNPNLKRQFPDIGELRTLLRFRAPALTPSARKKKRLTRAVTIWDLRTIAKRRTPLGPFDYTDGSAESESTLNRARETFARLEYQPAILRDVSSVSLQRTTLGHTFDMPVGIAPTGFTRMMHSEGERAGARAAAAFNIPFTLSTLGTTSIEDVYDAAPDGVNWFQLYMWKDRDRSMELVRRAQAAGSDNLLLTVDVPVAGARLRDVRNGLTIPPSLTAKTLINAAPRVEWWWNFLTTPPLTFAAINNWPGTVAELLDFMFDPTMTFEDLAWIREQWKGKLTIKGIQTVADAKKAAEYGADAIVLSNHGGRQLDQAPVPMRLLGDVKRELKSELEVHLDTGIMHGADIVAAIAQGAQFTYIGRAYLYGLMAGGQAGVERSLAILQTQMIRTMKLLGVSSLEELEPGHIKVLDRNS